MKKIVVTLDVYDEKSKQKAMKAVSSFPGVESISVDMKEGKLTVTGDVDPVEIVNKLRRKWHAVITALGPVKDEKKEAEAVASSVKKKKKEEEDKAEKEVAALLKAFHDQHRHLYLVNYHAAIDAEDHQSSQGCVIS